MVSIVIPTKGRSSILKLIQSIDESARAHDLVPSRDYEVVVAFDIRASQPKPEFGTSVRVVTSQGPGVNRARNTGARASTGDVIWFLDDDVELLGSDFHQTLNEIFNSSDRIAAGGNYLSRDGAPFIERGYNAFCSLWRVSAGVEGAEQLLGGTLAVRKSDWDRVGGFDESIEYGGAETSFVLRLNKLSGQILFDERLDVLHHSGARSLEAWKSLASRQAREKTTTESGLPGPMVRGQRALGYILRQDPRTLMALTAFTVPYLAMSKLASRKRQR